MWAFKSIKNTHTHKQINSHVYLLSCVRVCVFVFVSLQLVHIWMLSRQQSALCECRWRFVYACVAYGHVLCCFIDMCLHLYISKCVRLCSACNPFCCLFHHTPSSSRRSNNNNNSSSSWSALHPFQTHSAQFCLSFSCNARLQIADILIWIEFLHPLASFLFFVRCQCFHASVYIQVQICMSFICPCLCVPAYVRVCLCACVYVLYAILGILPFDSLPMLPPHPPPASNTTRATLECQ